MPVQTDLEFFKRQTKIVLRNCGLIDPYSIEEYIGCDGYQALAAVLTSLSPQEVINHYKRGILNVRVRVRSCDDNSCSGESWSSYYTDASGNSLSQPNNRYFQYEVYFETEDPDYTPELESVTIDRTLESAGSRTVVESVMVETASLILGISFLMYKFYLSSAN